MGLDAKILNDEVPITLALRSRRQSLDDQREVLMNRQGYRLVPLVRARTPALLIRGPQGARLKKFARLDLGPPGGPLQLMDRVPQFPDFRLLPLIISANANTSGD